MDGIDRNAHNFAETKLRNAITPAEALRQSREKKTATMVVTHKDTGAKVTINANGSTDAPHSDAKTVKIASVHPNTGESILLDTGRWDYKADGYESEGDKALRVELEAKAKQEAAKLEAESKAKK